MQSHSELNVTAKFFKLYNLLQSIYAVSDNDTAIYSLAQRLRGEIQKAVLTTIDEKI